MDQTGIVIHISSSVSILDTPHALKLFDYRLLAPPLLRSSAIMSAVYFDGGDNEP